MLGSKVAHLGVLRVNLIEGHLVPGEEGEDDILHPVMTIVIIDVTDDNISPIVVLLVNVGVRHHGGRAEHRQLAAARPRVLVQRQHRPVLGTHFIFLSVSVFNLIELLIIIHLREGDAARGQHGGGGPGHVQGGAVRVQERERLGVHTCTHGTYVNN